MKPLLLLAVLLFASPIISQEHAPTVDVCHADMAVWHRDMSLYKDLSIGELMKRSGEMFNCQTVDPPIKNDIPSLERTILYEQLYGFYKSQGEYRAVNFIVRHNMWKQFEKEDVPDSR